jgi:hypothetical protein
MRPTLAPSTNLQIIQLLYNQVKALLEFRVHNLRILLYSHFVDQRTPFLSTDLYTYEISVHDPD